MNLSSSYVLELDEKEYAALKDLLWVYAHGSSSGPLKSSATLQPHLNVLVDLSSELHNR